MDGTAGRAAPLPAIRREILPGGRYFAGTVFTGPLIQLNFGWATTAK